MVMLWHAKVHRFLLQHGQEAVMLYTAITSTPPVFHGQALCFKWVFPKIGVPQNGWFILENPIKMDDLGVSLFLETPKWSSQNNREWISSKGAWSVSKYDSNWVHMTSLHVPSLWRSMFQRKCGWHKQVSKRCWNLISQKMSVISHDVYVYITINIQFSSKSMGIQAARLSKIRR